MRVAINQARQHDVGVQRRIALNRAGFSVQTKLLFGQVLGQQTAQLRSAQAI